MKRSFLLLCAVLLVLGCALPCAAYRLARMTLAQSTAPSAAEAASAASEEGSGQATSPADTADTVCFTVRAPGKRWSCRCGSISSGRLPLKCRSAGRMKH